MTRHGAVFCLLHKHARPVLARGWVIVVQPKEKKFVSTVFPRFEYTHPGYSLEGPIKYQMIAIDCISYNSAWSIEYKTPTIDCIRYSLRCTDY